MRRLLSIFYVRKFDWLLTTLVLLLGAIGLVAIYSVDLSRGETLAFFSTQALSFGIGAAVLIVAASFHMSWYQGVARYIYLVSLLLLVAVLFFGTTIRGTTGWFRVAGFSFQPAEFAKIGLIIALGALIERYAGRYDRFYFIVATGILTFLLAVCILLQPDLGSALVLIGIWFGLLLSSVQKKRYILLLVGIFGVVSIVGWFFLLKPYQKDRLTTFLDPERDRLGAGYNVTQSIIAVGAGGWLGRGLGFGSQSQLHFLPEAQTDFIFAVIAEELGFAGVVVLLFLYGMLLLRLLYIATEARTNFAVFTILGIIWLLCIQITFNIGGAVGLLPVTGVTLPFVSYGGTSLIANMLLMGVAGSIAKSTAE